MKVQEIYNNNGINFFRFRQNNAHISYVDSLALFKKEEYSKIRMLRTYEEWQAMGRKIVKGQKAINVATKTELIHYFDFSQTWGEYPEIYSFPKYSLIIGAIDNIGGNNTELQFNDFHKDLQNVIRTFVQQTGIDASEGAIQLSEKMISYIVGANRNVSISEDEANNIALSIEADNIVKEIYKTIKEKEVVGYEYKQETRSSNEHSSRQRGNNRRVNEETSKSKKSRNVKANREVGKHSNEDARSIEQLSLFDVMFAREEQRVSSSDKQRLLGDGVDLERENVAKDNGGLVDGLSKPREDVSENRRNNYQGNNRTSSTREVEENTIYFPLYQEILDLKEKYQDRVIVKRVGDFYEVIGEDAVQVAEDLDLTLTRRDVGSNVRESMIGFPYHTIGIYIKKLIDNDYKLVIAEEDNVVLLDKNCIINDANNIASKYQLEDYRDKLQIDVENNIDGEKEPTFDKNINNEEPIVINDTTVERGTEEFTNDIQDEPIIEKIYIEPHNYIKEIDTQQVGVKTRYKYNIDAIKLVKELDTEDRNATLEEQQVLAKYTGWGGIPEVFDKNKSNWSNEYKELKGLLTEAEYQEANASILSAHYTNNTIIGKIYSAMDRFGVHNASMLEPALGIGNFLGSLPNFIDKSKVYGVEIDKISGLIAKKLYPECNIQINGFENTSFKNNSFDTAITNVPFGQYSVYDRDYINDKLLIHDYFITKSIDKVRPNGLCAFITSKGTLDKANTKVRENLAKKAELVGAIRLPNDAFNNANTKVTTDILFFKKRDVPVKVPNNSWIYVGKNKEGIPVNNYFLEHPEMILGKLVQEPTMYGGKDETTVVSDGRPLNIALDEAIKELPENIYTTTNNVVEFEELEAELNRKNYTYFVKNNEVYLYRDGVNELQAEWKSDNQKQVAIELIKLKEQTRKVLDSMLANCSDEELQLEQNRLNILYDDFVKKHSYLHKRGFNQTISYDAEYNLLLSIEEWDDKKQIGTKGKIFTERTIKRYEPITHTDDCQEALSVVMSEYGRVDLKEIEKLTDKDLGTILEELDSIIYRNPDIELTQERDNLYFGWETAEKYLSGNVKKKLHFAKEVASEKEIYKKNVEALEEVQPQRIPAEDISVRLGTAWIKPEYYKQFLLETMENSSYQAKANTNIEYSTLTGHWRISSRSKWIFSDTLMEQDLGTTRMDAFEVLEHCLNQTPIKIFDKVKGDDNKDHNVLNKQATKEATLKAKEWENRFQDWIFEDINRRNDLENTYNDLYNNIILPSFDGSYLQFPTMNESVDLYSHQKNAVHRIISSGNTLLHHCVGAGKTYTICASAMKLRQLGLANKPLIVVPNHLVNQWEDEFMKIYPNASVLMATDKDMSDKQHRQEFVSRVATCDWDAVIMPYSFFKMIPVSKERQEAQITKQKLELEEALEDMKTERGWGSPSFSERQIQSTIKSLETKLKKLIDSPAKDDVLNFEELGVDYLFVDEAHSFKNKYVPTKINNVRGISSSNSQRASDMEMKCQYINEIQGGEKGVVFATGTPISNSMSEMFIMQSYLNPNELAEVGLNHFDNWVANFGKISTSYEVSVSGKGMKAVTRLGQFVNIPELMTMYKQFADVETQDMLDLAVPEVERHIEKCVPTSYQEENSNEIIERGEQIANGGVAPEEDNMLCLTTDGKKNALDARLYNLEAEDEPVSKLNICAENIYENYIKYTDEQGTQMVFCDLSTPKIAYDKYKQGENFDVYNELKAKLVEKGIPKEQISFIHEAKTNKQKQTLFNKVRSGEIRVLMGSTLKCGTGANIQKHLVALHHLDAPYRPADLEQREGRIIRQGNLNKKVHIYTYLTEKTFDSYSYQILENKQRFIAQINNGSNTLRVADDIDEGTMNFATMKAISTGNPLFLERLNLSNEVRDLEDAYRIYKKNKYALEKNLEHKFPNDLEKYQKAKANVTNDIQLVKSNSYDKFYCKIGERTFTERKKAGAYLQAMYDKSKVGDTLGVINGLEIIKEEPRQSFVKELPVVENFVYLTGAGRYKIDIGTNDEGCIIRLENKAKNLENNLFNINEKIAKIEQDIEIARQKASQPFKQLEELHEKKSKLEEIDAELSLDKEEIVIAEDVELNSVIDIGEVANLETNEKNEEESAIMEEADAEELEIIENDISTKSKDNEKQAITTKEEKVDLSIKEADKSADSETVELKEAELKESCAEDNIYTNKTKGINIKVCVETKDNHNLKTTISSVEEDIKDYAKICKQENPNILLSVEELINNFANLTKLQQDDVLLNKTKSLLTKEEFSQKHSFMVKNILDNDAIKEQPILDSEFIELLQFNPNIREEYCEIVCKQVYEYEKQSTQNVKNTPADRKHFSSEAMSFISSYNLHKKDSNNNNTHHNGNTNGGHFME